MITFDFNRDVLVEAIKEWARVALIAAVPILISQLETGKVDWKVISVAAVIALLKALDKGLHLWGKEEGNAAETGLTRF